MRGLKALFAAGIACSLLAIAVRGASKQQFLTMPESWHRGWSSPVYLPQLKTFLCTHAKAGCSTLRSLLLIWSGDLQEPHWTSHFKLFSFGQYNRDFIEVVRDPKVASKYLKDPDILSVAFVRDPLGRFMSMFVNKMLTDEDSDLKNIGVKFGGDRRTVVFRKSDRDLPDFGIHKFIDEVHKHRGYAQTCTWEEHLDLQSCRCGHRFVDYDFVGRAENFEDDLETWLLQINRSDLVPKKSEHENPSNKTITNTLLASLTRDDRRKLWEIYAEDYFRFGYDPATLGSDLDF